MNKRICTYHRFFVCGGRRGILNLLHKLISRCLENRCHRFLKLLRSHVQLLDGHCHLLLWSQHGLLARGATRRAQLSYPQRLPTFDTELGLQSLSDCFALSLDRLDTSVSWSSPLHAFPLGALRSTRQQVSFPVFRDAITVPLFREATITAPLPCCECMRWDVTYTHVFCAWRRAAGFVSHMFTHALTVCTQGMILID